MHLFSLSCRRCPSFLCSAVLMFWRFPSLGRFGPPGRRALEISGASLFFYLFFDTWFAVICAWFASPFFMFFLIFFTLLFTPLFAASFFFSELSLLFSFRAKPAAHVFYSRIHIILAYSPFSENTFFSIFPARKNQKNTFFWHWFFIEFHHFCPPIFASFFLSTFDGKWPPKWVRGIRCITSLLGIIFEPLFLILILCWFYVDLHWLALELRPLGLTLVSSWAPFLSFGLTFCFPLACFGHAWGYFCILWGSILSYWDPPGVVFHFFVYFRWIVVPNLQRNGRLPGASKLSCKQRHGGMSHNNTASQDKFDKFEREFPFILSVMMVAAGEWLLPGSLSQRIKQCLSCSLLQSW